MKNKVTKRYWIGIPPWIILGAVLVLVPIFVFMTFENIHRQKENTTTLLVEKGAALIRSFEAGARTGMKGMMGMRGGGFQPQKLLMETALDAELFPYPDTLEMSLCPEESVHILLVRLKYIFSWNAWSKSYCLSLCCIFSHDWMMTY